MAKWYDKYLSIYGKPFSEVPQEIVDGTRQRLAALQSDNPIASIVVIGYNASGTLLFSKTMTLATAQSILPNHMYPIPTIQIN